MKLGAFLSGLDKDSHPNQRRQINALNPDHVKWFTEKQRRQIKQVKLFCQDTLACLSIFIATGAMLWILPLMQGASQ